MKNSGYYFEVTVNNGRMICAQDTDSYDVVKATHSGKELRVQGREFSWYLRIKGTTIEVRLYQNGRKIKSFKEYLNDGYLLLTGLTHYQDVSWEEVNSVEEALQDMDICTSILGQVNGEFKAPDGCQTIACFTDGIARLENAATDTYQVEQARFWTVVIHKEHDELRDMDCVTGVLYVEESTERVLPMLRRFLKRHGWDGFVSGAMAKIDQVA